MNIYLNIGSNIGNRLALIDRAIALIADAWPGCRLDVSHPVESAPWGYASPNPYVNVGVAIRSAADTAPERVLERVQAIERAVSDTPHRNADGSYCDRPIDIDIIAIDEMTVDTTRLMLPHPRMHLRRFVLEPMVALAPDWKHPMLGLTSAQMLERLDD